MCSSAWIFLTLTTIQAAWTVQLDQLHDFRLTLIIARPRTSPTQVPRVRATSIQRFVSKMKRIMHRTHRIIIIRVHQTYRRPSVFMARVLWITIMVRSTWADRILTNRIQIRAANVQVISKSLRGYDQAWNVRIARTIRRIKRVQVKTIRARVHRLIQRHRIH